MVISDLVVALRASPPSRCSWVGAQQGGNVVFAPGSVNAIQDVQRRRRDLPSVASIARVMHLVPVFFTFSASSDTYTFINDFKMLKADVAKLFAQIVQSYV